MITIVDYGMGNLGSILNMLKRIGTECCISSSAREILEADKLILPGVGHFDSAMRNLESLDLIGPLNEAVMEHGKPVLGICLGQQLLTRGSEEGNLKGLGWIDAEARRFVAPEGKRLQVPHMGWNVVDVVNPSPLFDDTFPDSRFYFVHSFRVLCDRNENVMTTTDYAGTFHSGIIRDNIMGVQFHPEKSHQYGYRLLTNFAHWDHVSGTSSQVGGSLFSRTDIAKKPAVEVTSRPARTGQRVPTRVIPTLLLKGQGLVKTIRFKDPKYVGDPRNAVKIFNEKEVDELAILDIDATINGRGPDFELLGEIISEAFMPVAYGGGIRSLDQARKLLAMGAEKIMLNSGAVELPELVEQSSRQFGAQSVVVVIDVRKGGLFSKGPNVCYRGGSKTIQESPVDFARRMEGLGAGEILVQSIDQEGTRKGFDLDLIRSITDAVDIPVIASGGADTVEDFGRAVNEAGASAVAAGSIFVFQGRHRAVLISYPKPDVLQRALNTES